MIRGFDLDFKSKGEIYIRNPQFTIMNVWKDKKGTIPFDSIQGIDSFYIDFKIYSTWTKEQNKNKSKFIKAFPFIYTEVLSPYGDEDNKRLWICDDFILINDIIRYPVQMITSSKSTTITKEYLKDHLWGTDGRLVMNQLNYNE